MDELIQQLCPDGVEYKELGAVCKFQNGFAFKSSKFTNDGLPIIRITNIQKQDVDISSLVYFNKQDYTENLDSYIISKGDVLVAMSGATTGKIGCYNFDIPAYLNQRVGKFVPNSKELNNRFLFHFLLSKINEIYYMAGGGAQPNLSSVKLMQTLIIPIPPLPIQQEIVTILDKFTQLDAELEAELEARKKQYEFYRNQLLNFDGKEVEWKTLEEICKFSNGKGHEKNIVENGHYIVVNSKFVSTEGNVKKYSENQLCPLYKNDVLMVMSDLPNGRALAKCFIVDSNDKYTLNQRICSLSVKNEKLIIPKFLFYIANRNQQLLRYDNGADQTNLRKDDILKVSVPIPPISEQERIVSILDKFDAMVNDISIGLPAEIEARRKQYEYYRGRLLNFKNVNNG